MNPKVFKPKTSRDRRGEAIVRLRQRWQKEHEDEEWAADKEPVITPMFEAVGIPRILNALRMHDEEDARAFIETYEQCNPTERERLPLEVIAFASGIGSLRLAEIANSALFLCGEMETNMLLAAHLPAIVAKSLKVAKTTKGVQDREFMLKAGKILPIAKGAQIAFVNNNGEKQLEEAPRAPAWKEADERLREFHDMTEPKRLPSPEAVPMSIGGHIDHMQQETVEILRGE